MGKKTEPKTYDDLKSLAKCLRKELGNEKPILLFAYNRTGKTRLSVEFKDLGKQKNEEGETTSDTLYYNAFTEDLFTWDNDLVNDENIFLKLNSSSKFFSGLEELEMETRIRSFLNRYADFEFKIDYENWNIVFSREVREKDKTEIQNHIKISRAEERIFILCFFLAIIQLVKDGQEAYDWVKYIYIDDPISSMDDNNTITFACQLANLIKNNTDTDNSQASRNDIKFVISSHHALFFNVMFNELETKYKKAIPYFFKKDQSGKYTTEDTKDTPHFHHIALLKQIYDIAKNENENENETLYTYHFNILRNILEKTAAFHGSNKFSDCLKADSLDPTIYSRIINLLSHGNYSLFDPVEMLDENKEHFRKILDNFMKNYKFNKEIFPGEQEINHD